jgi:carbon storage regulator
LLVLTRCKNQEIVIGDNVIVKIADIVVLEDGQIQVRVGITAPREIPVNRMEVWQAIQREQAEVDAENAKRATLRGGL